MSTDPRGEPAPTEPFVAIADLYDAVMDRVPYDEWVEYVELLVRHWRGSRERVLDLACGTGTVGLRLAERGSQVVGVDRSLGMLRVAREKAREAGLTLGWVRQDMAALGLAGGFDLCLCLFDSLNYLLETERLQAAFVGVRRALGERGLFIFDVNTEAALEEDLFTQDDLGPDATVRLRWRSRYDRRTRLATVDMEFFLDGGQTVTETHRQRAYTPRELRDALAAAGFKTLAVYDAYTFNLPRRDSDRVYYVCRAG